MLVLNNIQLPFYSILFVVELLWLFLCQSNLLLTFKTNRYLPFKTVLRAAGETFLNFIINLHQAEID